MAPGTVVGRASELAATTRFLNDASPGPGALLLEGSAGIGKTTVWREVVRTAGSRSRVLSAQPSENESKLSFSVLTDLLAPTLDEITGQLPVPQRRALEAALLLRAPDASSRVDARAASLATLRALRTLAERTPVTIAIDDVQWTDAPSARSLSFALRRLTNERIIVIAARRIMPGLEEPIGLANMSTFHRLELGPLPADELARVLRRLEHPFPRPLLRRIATASRGNPFFALEVGAALARSAFRPSAGEPLPVPEDLHALLSGRCDPVRALGKRCSSRRPLPRQRLTSCRGCAAQTWASRSRHVPGSSGSAGLP